MRRKAPPRNTMYRVGGRLGLTSLSTTTIESSTRFPLPLNLWGLFPLLLLADLPRYLFILLPCFHKLNNGPSSSNGQNYQSDEKKDY